jgi:SPP1 gp7 family putative phage head morphogenesis protein
VKEQRASADEVFDPAFWRAQTEDLATDLYESVVAVAGARVSAQFGVTFDVTSPFVAQFIEERAKQLAGFVTDTTYSDIRLALNEGVSAGEGIPDLAKRITKVFDQASTTRATTIARTEVISAYNGSAVRVAAQEGAAVVGGQEWISAEDNRTREAHLSADGQIVPIGQPFYVGGRAMAYPGDPAGGASNTVNCRCTVAFLTPDEMGARRAYVEQRTALAMLALVRPGVPFDGAAYRQALNEVAAA